MVLYAAVEAGGTTFVVAVFEDDVTNIIRKKSIKTTNPDETISQILEFFESYKTETGKNYDALGIASFGPIDLDKNSNTYGFITTTPKKKWQNCDILGRIKEGLGISKVEFDTDVNGAALAMAIHYTTIKSIVYITVGTGIGVGVLANGQLIHGALHPEAGHIFVKKVASDADFQGTCPFHGDCVEGLCATGSIAARKNIPQTDLADLSDDDEVWDSVAFYLAQLSFSLACIVSPQIIVIGGGVMQRTILFPKVKQLISKLNNGYLSLDLASMIQESPYGQDAGIIGAAALAKSALTQ